MEKKLPFLETLYNLRTIEQLILFGKAMEISAREETESIALLRVEYEKEQLNHPFESPAFDADAALWAGKMIYFSAQFLLNRENTGKDLNTFFPDFKKSVGVSALLSADLCMRFLPQILQEFRTIDIADPAIPILERHLETFHYSSIGFDGSSEKIDFKLFENQCFQQLYVDRVTERKAIGLSQIPQLNTTLRSNFGNYANVFWRNFEVINETQK